MTSSALPVVEPDINPETKPFWDATLEGRFLIKSCNDCGENFWYPRTICPFCASFDTRWTEVSGRGEVYSFSIVRKGFEAFAERTPYVLAYVQLEEGPRVMTNVIDCDVESLKVGDPVELEFEPAEGAARMYRFRPA